MRCCPFTDDELKTWATPSADMPMGAIRELITPVVIRNTPALNAGDVYQLAVITYCLLINAGVDLAEFKRVCEDPDTWTMCTYKPVLEGDEDVASGVYYMKIFEMGLYTSNEPLMKLQTIQLVAMILKTVKMDIGAYVDLVERIMLSSGKCE